MSFFLVFSYLLVHLANMLVRYGSCTSESPFSFFSPFDGVLVLFTDISLPSPPLDHLMDLADLVVFMKNAGGPVVLGDCTLGR